MVGEVAMSKRRIDWVISMVGVLLLGMALVQGQQAPDMIVFNAKIVTVNDKGFESKPERSLRQWLYEMGLLSLSEATRRHKSK